MAGVRELLRRGLRSMPTERELLICGTTMSGGVNFTAEASAPSSFPAWEKRDKTGR